MKSSCAMTGMWNTGKNWRNDDKMSQKLYIRVDANAKVAMGHLMRCLTIADACKEQNMELEFIMAEDTCQDLVEQRGYRTWILNTDYTRMEEELPQLTACFQHTPETESHALLVDSYQVSATYLETLSKLLPVIVMDDMGEQPWPVQAVVNYNHYAIHLPYTELYRKQNTRLFLGSAYTPLRPMFAEAAKDYEVRPRVKDILISTGGGDPLRIADKLVHALVMDSAFPSDMTLHVLCGPFSKSYEPLTKYAEIVGEDKLQLHANVTDMAGLISSCDLAVSATGSTIYEICAIGVPAVSFYFAENQRQGAEELDRIGAIPCAGGILYKSETSGAEKSVLHAIVDQLKTYSRDFRLRQGASAYMRGIVDGRGAGRLAEEFARLLQ